MSKFCYEEGELQIVDCQCELCIYFNDGKRSDICPSDLLDKIVSNDCLCPKLKEKSIIELGTGLNKVNS